MVKKLLIAVAVVLVALVGFIATRPDEMRVERSAVINTSPDVVQTQVADFRKWQDWSPWAGMDPNQKITYSGPDTGVGANYKWVGNDDVGEGQMTITALKPNESVTMDLEFIKPFAAKHVVELHFKPEGQGTKTTWVMTGKNGFMSKAAGVFMDMDSMLGKDFEKGLAKLKTLSEAEAKKIADAKAAASASATPDAAAAPTAATGTP